MRSEFRIDHSFQDSGAWDAFGQKPARPQVVDAHVEVLGISRGQAGRIGTGSSCLPISLQSGRQNRQMEPSEEGGNQR